MSLLDTLFELEEEDKIIRAPFPYPGGKSRSIGNILPRLPYRGIYVEPFGGSAAVLLSRRKSKFEVFNDRYAGVVAFYRVMRSESKMRALCERLELTVHAREEWAWAKETWQNVEDDVERAALWYYLVSYSFASLGRNFGRSTTTSPLAGKIRRRLEAFPLIHERLCNVQIENQDWRQCLADYDNDDTVFYLDPPYLAVNMGAYKHEMSHDDHRRLLDTVMSLRGFVALSGYSNPLYEAYDWDNRHEWDAYVSMTPSGDIKGNYKEGIETKREKATEVLWIKEAK